MDALATLIETRFAWRTHEPEHLERIPV
jgi:hypothetical protein